MHDIYNVTIKKRTIFTRANGLDFQTRLVMKDQFAETVKVAIGPFWRGRAYGWEVFYVDPGNQVSTADDNSICAKNTHINYCGSCERGHVAGHAAYYKGVDRRVGRVDFVISKQNANIGARRKSTKEEFKIDHRWLEIMGNNGICPCSWGPVRDARRWGCAYEFALKP